MNSDIGVALHGRDPNWLPRLGNPRRNELEGRIYLVCGASDGLGRAVAEQIVQAGGKIWAVSRRNPLPDLPDSKVRRVQADLAEADGVSAVVDNIARSGDALDGLLINGPGPAPGRLLELSIQEWHKALDALIVRPLELIRLLAGRLTKDCSIVFVTSSSVREPIPELDASNVLRPGVTAIANILSKSLAPSVRVNSIAPGRILTTRLAEVERRQAQAANLPLDEFRTDLTSDIPMGRYGHPDEFAASAVFLLSPASSYVTGTALHVDGGLLRGP